MGQRILAYFGADLQDTSPSYLGDCAREGFTLLALDPPALYMARQAGLEHTLLDDWVDPVSRLEARRMAETWDREWYVSSREAFTIEGICWPQIDRHAMNWFWSEAAYATKLAESFHAGKVQSVRLFRSGPPRPSIYYSPADIFNSCLGSLHRGAAFAVELVPRPRGLVKGIRRQFERVGRRLLRDVKSLSTGTRNTFAAALPGASPDGLRPGGVVFAFNAGEMFRFLPVVKHVRARTPEGASVAIVDTGYASTYPGARSAPQGLRALLSRSELCARFLRGMEMARREAAGAPWEQVLHAARFHFDHYCSERWPRLVADHRAWRQIWSAVRPSAVVVSSLYDAESQLPALAARELGIETFSIPHGGSHMLDDLISAEKVLCGYELQRRLWKLGGIPDERLISCKGVVPTNEYPVRAYPMESAHGKLRILVLLDPVAAFDQRLLPRVSLASQLEALNTLANPRADLAGSVTTRIKTHPNHPERELFLSCDRSMDSMVLPPDHSLDDALEHADLVVTLNYVGSAFIHVHLLGKPVLHFWNDPLVGETGLESIGDLISAGGLRIARADQFWDEIDRILRDPSAMEALSRESQEYAGTYLEDRGFLAIEQVLPGIHDRLVPTPAEKLLEPS